MTKNSVVIDAIARKHEFSKSKSKIMSRQLHLLSASQLYNFTRYKPFVKVYSAKL